MNIDFQDRIDDYVIGRMSENDKHQFEMEVSQDKEKQECLEFTQNVRTTLSSHEHKRTEITKMSEQYKSGHRHHIGIWTSGIAAILIVGFFLFKPQFNSSISPVSLSVDMYRGDGTLSNIVRLVNEKKYNEAIISIECIERDFDDNTLEKTEKFLMDSISDYERQRLQYKQGMRQHTMYTLLWFKANAYIGLRHYEQAADVLNDLRLSECEYKTSADSLYHLIKD